VNNNTGLISVAVSAGGHTYKAAVDNGSAYTWFSERTVQDWIREHPDWERGTGAVGESNMQMASWWSSLFYLFPGASRSPRMVEFLERHSPGNRESKGTIVRLPEIAVGSVQLRQIGVFGVEDVFDWYSQKTPGPVVGWLGGNILKSFRLTIDFPNHMTYWQRQSDPDPRDLDQVGLTLLALNDDYFVVGIASQNGRRTVDGIQVGDRLVQVDGLRATGASRAAVLSALHGRVGEIRTIAVERDAKQVTVQASVRAF
jgi:hypothetical protein